MKMSKRKTTAFITLSIVGGLVGCGSVSLDSLTGTKSSPGSSSEAEATSSSSPESSSGEAPSAEDITLDETVFTGLTEKQNKRSARILKREFRDGSIAKLLPEGEAFAMLETLCGVKVWDRCDVAFHHAGNKLGWNQWAFKQKGETRVYWYPEMLYDKAEPHWARLAVDYILRSGDHGGTLVKMTQKKCGDPFNTRCQVRAFGGSGYELIVKKNGELTGEVINVMKTLEGWREDL